MVAYFLSHGQEGAYSDLGALLLLFRLFLGVGGHGLSHNRPPSLVLGLLHFFLELIPQQRQRRNGRWRAGEAGGGSAEVESGGHGGLSAGIGWRLGFSGVWERERAEGTVNLSTSRSKQFY
jgi:hypothetical protein